MNKLLMASIAVNVLTLAITAGAIGFGVGFAQSLTGVIATTLGGQP